MVGDRRKKQRNPAAVVRRRRKRPDTAPDQVRAFCALPLDEATRDALRAAIEPARERLRAFRWVPSANWHVTVKFFGDIDLGGVDALAEALAGAATGPVGLEFRAMGAFPDMRNPRTLWIGVKCPDNRLKQLHQRVNDACAGLGYQLDTRRLRPHLTVARPSKLTPHPVARELTPLMDASIATTVARELVLYRSVLTSDGPIYTPLRRIPLDREES